MFKLIAFIVVIPATVLSSIAVVQTALAPGRSLSDRKSRVGCQEGLRRSLRYRSSMVVERHKNQGFEFKPLPAAKSASRILATERQ